MMVKANDCCVPNVDCLLLTDSVEKVSKIGRRAEEKAAYEEAIRRYQSLALEQARKKVSSNSRPIKTREITMRRIFATISLTCPMH